MKTLDGKGCLSWLATPPKLTRLFATFIVLATLISVAISEDFYELLGIERDADAKDIRVAFKKLALTMHPDKNPDDPKAHDNFVRINRAYEVLKDDELRKKYDRFGEEGLKENQNQQWNRYESWQFYKTEFGLYDEDPEIVTLSKSDFEQSVHSGDIWIVNFYSPRCHHCHDLAPTWREFAKEVEGVIRVGAVNCWDDRPLCTAQGVQRFPTLFVYPKHEEYKGTRTLDPLVKFALNLVEATIHPLWSGNFKSILLADGVKNQPWVISYCAPPEGKDGQTADVARVGCLDNDDQLKLAAILNKVVNVGSVDCLASAQLCEKLKIEESAVRFYEKAKGVTQGGKELELEQPKQIADEVLKLMPDLPSFSSSELKEARSQLEEGRNVRPVVTYFMDKPDEHDLELKKLPYLLTDMKVKKFNCSADLALCNDLYIGSRLPKVALFRKGGGYEFHHGRLFAQDIAAFARHSLYSRLRVLGPNDFPGPVIDSGEPWFVDFFSPHCPPCRQLIPEIRKVAASMTFVNFGTVDCTTHQALCNQQNIRSYPTTILYNVSKPHVNVGFSNAQSLKEFIEDTLNPKVVSLSAELFDSLVKKRNKDDVWVVDFYAPWCGPCMALMPEWRRVGKRLSGTANVGSVDCVANTALCQQLGISGYPTIRAYPAGSTGTYKFSDYNGWNRDATSIIGWIHNFLPSAVETITKNNFRDLVLRSSDPWVVDFYAPWCGPCMQFMPSLEEIAKALEGHVRVGKINCQMYQSTCMQASIQAYPTLRIYKGTETKGYSQNWYGEHVNQKEPHFLIPHLRKRFTKKLESSSRKKDEL